MLYTSAVPSFKFIHTADIHLDSPLKGLTRYEGLPVDEIRKATRSAFDNLVQFACDEEVDFVIIAGDTYDGDWKDMGTGLYFQAGMSRLTSARIRVYIIKGNHDATSQVTRSLPPLENVVMFSDRVAQTHRIDDLEVAIHGRSFANRHVSEDMTPNYPDHVTGYFNIGVLHTSLAGYVEHEVYAPCSLDTLAAKGYNYWALGHVHEHAVLRKDPYVVFSGALQGRHIRETGPKGAVLVEVDNGEVRKLHHVPLDVCRWANCPVSCDDTASLDDVHNRLRTALRATLGVTADDRPVIVRVSLTGSTTLHELLMDRRTQLREDVLSIATELSNDLWVEKVEIRTGPVTHREINASSESLLLPPTSEPEVLQSLQDELMPFLNVHQKSLSGDEPPLVRLARTGDWKSIAEVASDALYARLIEGRS